MAAEVSNAYFVNDGMVYEMRVKVRDFEECVVIKSSDKDVLPAGTVLGKNKWWVMLDQANYRAIYQKDFELRYLQQELADLEHTAERMPSRVDATILQDLRSRTSTLKDKVERMKYHGPTIIRLPV